MINPRKFELYCQATMESFSKEICSVGISVSNKESRQTLIIEDVLNEKSCYLFGIDILLYEKKVSSLAKSSNDCAYINMPKFWPRQAKYKVSECFPVVHLDYAVAMANFPVCVSQNLLSGKSSTLKHTFQHPFTCLAKRNGFLNLSCSQYAHMSYERWSMAFFHDLVLKYFCHALSVLL